MTRMGTCGSRYSRGLGSPECGFLKTRIWAWWRPGVLRVLRDDDGSRFCHAAVDRFAQSKYGDVLEGSWRRYGKKYDPTGRMQHPLEEAENPGPEEVVLDGQGEGVMELLFG
jgi:hypothetical protein